MRQSFVFLDINGVLRPGNSGELSRLPDFESFLRAHPSVGVVFTSKLRLTMSLQELTQLLSPDLQARVKGLTSVVSEEKADSREVEIRTWMLKTNSYGCYWAALDDQSHLFAPSCKELVRCSPLKGFQQEQRTDLVSVLALA